MTLRQASLAAVALLLAGSATATTSASNPVSSGNKPGGLAGIYLAARHAEAVSDDNRATSLLNRALEMDPGNQSIQRQTYFLAAQVGDFHTAAAAAMRSDDGSAQLALAPLIVMVDLYHDKKYDQAWTYIDKIPVQSAVGFALPMIRAWGMAPRQPAEAAIAELAPLQSMSGAGDLYAVMAGLLNEYYGRKAQALTEYDALAARIEQVPPSIVRLVAAGYRRLGKPEETVTLAKKLAAVRGASPLLDDLANSVVDPNAPRTVTAADGMAESLFGASQMLLQSVNSPFGVQLAVVYGQAALYLNPNLTIARRVVSVALAGRERFAEANAILAPIKKNEANYPSVQMQIADNYERMDKPDQALAVLEDIVKTHPTLPDAYIALGDHMRRIKRFEDAVKDYDQAAKLSPNGEPPQSWQFYYARGIALERSKQWDRADADLRKAIALKPDEASVLNYLGYSLIDRGLNLDEGRQLIEKALKLKPDDGYIIDSMGWALYLTGDMNGAVVHLEKAVETNPSDPTINEHLGDAYWKVGRKTEAYFQWRRALGLEPDDDQRTALQQKLAQGMARN